MQQRVELEEPKVTFAGANKGMFHAEEELDDISIKLLDNIKKLRIILKKYKVFCSIAH